MKKPLIMGCKNGAIRIDTDGPIGMFALPATFRDCTCDEALHIMYNYHAENLSFVISEIKRTRKEVTIKFKNGFLVKVRPLTKSELYAYELKRPRTISPRWEKIEKEIGSELFESIRNLGKQYAITDRNNGVKAFNKKWYADHLIELEKNNNLYRLEKSAEKACRNLDYNCDNINEILNDFITEAEDIVPVIDLQVLRKIMEFSFHEVPQMRIDLALKNELAYDQINRVKSIITSIWRQEGVI